MAQEGNPLKDDPTLRNQLIQLDRVKSRRKWEPWKRSFTKRFESFLDQSGVEKAQEAYEQLSRDMDRTVSLVQKCEEMNQMGALTNERATVKGRHALNEMVNDLVVRWGAIKEMVPGTGDEEEARGYNKFMLGAILVRDDFSEYERMEYVYDTIQIMGEDTLKEVADRVHIEQFANYQIQFQRFCDLLADLGLYEGTTWKTPLLMSSVRQRQNSHDSSVDLLFCIVVMMACRHFSNCEDEDEESLVEEESCYSEEGWNIIVVDMKTAGIFKMNVDTLESKGVLSLGFTDMEEPYIIQSCETWDKREEIKDKLNKHPTLGLATHLVIKKSTVIEEEYTELEEKEAVTNMWGITLKSTNKKSKKNEELFFFDPYTGAVGELNRQAAIDRGCIHEDKNELNKLVLRESETDDSQWEFLRGQIRNIIGMQMEAEGRDDVSSTMRSGRESISMAY